MFHLLPPSRVATLLPTYYNHGNLAIASFDVGGRRSGGGMSAFSVSSPLASSEMQYHRSRPIRPPSPPSPLFGLFVPRRSEGDEKWDFKKYGAEKHSDSSPHTSEPDCMFFLKIIKGWESSYASYRSWQRECTSSGQVQKTFYPLTKRDSTLSGTYLLLKQKPRPFPIPLPF